MKICVTAGASGLDAPFDTRFGRCPFFTVVETDEMTVESIPNSIAESSCGAGMHAAQVVARLGVTALITGKVGPNALQTLSAAGIDVYQQLEGTVREAAELFKKGGLQKITSLSAQLSPSICRGQMGQEATRPGKMSQKRPWWSWNRVDQVSGGGQWEWKKRQIKVVIR